MRGGRPAIRPGAAGPRRRPHGARHAAVAALLLVLGGCSADRPLNPSFPLAYEDAKAELRSMGDEPVPALRPVVIASGIHDPGLAGANLEQRLRRVVGEDTIIIRVAFLDLWSFDSCRERLVRTVEQTLPTPDREWTIEVDVIGVSMGGLVARYATRPHEDGLKRLNIRRLFTVATPHCGAALAGLPTLDPRAVDMRRGSSFLSDLDEAEPDADYELYAYARLGDMIVGAENSALEGHHPWWVATPPLSFAHLWASGDPRIVADIARRLRGEPAYATHPAAPLPGAEPAAMASHEAGPGEPERTPAACRQQP